jgi:hypothetical protein
MYLVVRIGMELPTEKFPGGKPRYTCLRIVKFDIDDTVTCSCKYHQRVGIPCHHIIAVVGDFLCIMIDVRWRNTLQHYCGANCFDNNMTHILLKAVNIKRKACRCVRPTHCETYPVFNRHADEKYGVPFENYYNYYRSFGELKVYVNSLKLPQEQVVFEDEVFGEGFVSHDDYDAEVDNDFPDVGNASTIMSSYRQMLIAECEMEIPMKPYEVLTEPYHFICDYAELGPEYLEYPKAQMDLVKIAMLEFH